MKNYENVVAVTHTHTHGYNLIEEKNSNKSEFINNVSEG